MAHPNDTLTDAKILLLAEQHLYSSTNIFGTLNFARAIVNALSIDAAPPAIDPDKTILELLDELDLSVRVRNSLIAELSNSDHASPLNLNSPASEFLQLSREELFHWPNIGGAALHELEAKLKEKGLYLSDMSPSFNAITLALAALRSDA